MRKVTPRCFEGPLSHGEIEAFHEKIYEFYASHGRDLPWRWTTDAYSIFVSEVMLQQTQVERVKGKYEEFLGVFPGFSSLAAASLREVLSIWQGLGYNRRALSLWHAAIVIMGRYGGMIPTSVDELSGLPGIGRATASAILTFAFAIPLVFVETNIRRVFIDQFFQGKGDVRDREIAVLVGQTLDRADPRTWYYALMDYGSMLGRGTHNPNRKSSLYRKQTPFKESDRKIRGAVLRLLLTDSSVSADALDAAVGSGADRLKDILLKMKKEGLVKEEAGNYSIP